MSKKKSLPKPPSPKAIPCSTAGKRENQPHSKGLLTYELGKEGETGSLALRLTANGEGGLFSREWIALDAIHAILEQQQAVSPSRVFRPFRFNQAAPTTPGFFAAVLRSLISVLSEVDGSRLFMHHLLRRLRIV